MSQLISVSVLIGDRTYRLKVSPEDEEKLRNTVKKINKQIVEYKTAFAGKDMQDYIAMVLLWLATEQNEESGNNPEALKTAADKISSLKIIIEKTLEEKLQ